jgi:phosphoribosylformimino-5-aminoimidazole carboxamide ribotide isomerase
MKFRPCIDLHEGKVKQIVGETLDTDNQRLKENFVSNYDSTYYAALFKQDSLSGGHVIMLGNGNETEAIKALHEYPGGLQIGGGINEDNATYFLNQGASHVIVTSYIFRNGHLDMKNLEKIKTEVGVDNLVIDLSCKERKGKWYIVTNQWNQFSDFELNKGNIQFLEQYCNEFLIHAVDVEGKQSGIQQRLVSSLAEWVSIPTTYAGGARSLSDIKIFNDLTSGKLDITVGSALDIFGGTLPYNDVVDFYKNL